ncbi:MAG TPA: cytochrome C oxidase subunit II [Devosia sp.]|nr:cytochrome C oxidase subunit II [Devosia sp.]
MAGSSEREIQRAELQWGAVMAGAVGVLLAIVVVGSAAATLHPPSNVERVDPASLHVSGEFVDGNLGSTQNLDGSVTVRFIATQFSFVPRCLEVPADTPVVMRTTSPDVIHALLVTGTNTDTMIVPGYVSEVKTRFAAPGDYRMPCTEFCGPGHADMWSVVRVVPRAEWKPDADDKVRCEITNQ